MNQSFKTKIEEKPTIDNKMHYFLYVMLLKKTKIMHNVNVVRNRQLFILYFHYPFKKNWEIKKVNVRAENNSTKINSLRELWHITNKTVAIVNCNLQFYE